MRICIACVKTNVQEKMSCLLQLHPVYLSAGVRLITPNDCIVELSQQQQHAGRILMLQVLLQCYQKGKKTAQFDVPTNWMPTVISIRPWEETWDYSLP